MIVYTEHLELRLKLRQIPYGLPKKLYLTAYERYFDRDTQLLIAVKEVKYKNKQREFALIYKRKINEVILITLHPLKPYQKLGRIKSGRWQKV
ncbi:hypothetical protein HYV91_01100 [Candidatus Wolfebacteria bacterium]|nr:hypothetical protein [Candidatus Wolfebacteria bacterium]